MRIRWILCSLLGLALVADSAHGQVPTLIHYQGILTDQADTPVDVAVPITFRLYDEPVAGNELWAETHASVTIENGVF